MGYDFQLVYHPPEREIIEVNSGHIQGLAGRYSGFSTEKKHPNIIRVEEPIYYLQYIGLSMNPSIRIDGWETVKGYKITYEQGTKYIEDNIYKYVNKTDVIVAMSFKQSLELLKSGRVDLYLEIDDVQAIVKLLPENKNIKFYWAGNLGKVVIYPFVNRKETELAANLSETLRVMKADGTYDKLLKTIPKND
jgi:ABC-type amino acid transport substrate-binding protein